MPRASRTIFNSIKASAVTGLTWDAARNSNLYIDSNVLSPGADIFAYKQRIPLERDTVMVFVDEAPRFNWAHPCRYLLFDAGNGEMYREVRAQFPPYLIGDAPKSFNAFHQPVHIPDKELYYPILPPLRCPVIRPKGQRYAVLFSGASNNRHTNDLEFLYRTLRNIYGFPAAHIYVLNYDGAVNYSGGPQPVVSWPGDSTGYRVPINGQGTRRPSIRCSIRLRPS